MVGQLHTWSLIRVNEPRTLPTRAARPFSNNSRSQCQTRLDCGDFPRSWSIKRHVLRFFKHARLGFLVLVIYRASPYGRKHDTDDSDHGVDEHDLVDCEDVYVFVHDNQLREGQERREDEVRDRYVEKSA